MDARLSDVNTFCSGLTQLIARMTIVSGTRQSSSSRNNFFLCVVEHSVKSMRRSCSVSGISRSPYAFPSARRPYSSLVCILNRENSLYKLRPIHTPAAGIAFEGRRRGAACTTALHIDGTALLKRRWSNVNWSRKAFVHRRQRPLRQ